MQRSLFLLIAFTVAASADLSFQKVQYLPPDAELQFPSREELRQEIDKQMKNLPDAQKMWIRVRDGLYTTNPLQAPAEEYGHPVEARGFLSMLKSQSPRAYGFLQQIVQLLRKVRLAPIDLEDKMTLGDQIALFTKPEYLTIAEWNQILFEASLNPS